MPPAHWNTENAARLPVLECIIVVLYYIIKPKLCTCFGHSVSRVRVTSHDYPSCIFLGFLISHMTQVRSCSIKLSVLEFLNMHGNPRSCIANSLRPSDDVSVPRRLRSVVNKELIVLSATALSPSR
jgi:hypothetical protein